MSSIQEEVISSTTVAPGKPKSARAQRVPGAAEGLRVLIVDRDPQSRSALEQLCRANGLQPLPTADTGAFALQLARMLNPNLILVDSDLPDVSGVDLLDELKGDTVVSVIVTDRTDLAVQAYDAGALDYLVRPVSGARLARAIARARVWLSGSSFRGGQACERCSDSGPSLSYPTRTPTSVLVGERQHRLYVLDPARIEYVEAEGNYVIFHAASREYLSRDTLKRLEPILQSCGFLRIENSLLLNVGAIDYAVPVGRGRFVFTLRSGATLRSSRTYRPGILQRLPLVRGSREVTSGVYDDPANRD